MAKSKTRTDRVAVVIINTLTVLFLLALVCLFFYAARPRHLLGHDTSLSYTVTLNTVRAEYTTDIHVGDRVLDAVGKREIGRVESYKITPAVTETYSRRRNCLRAVEYPDHVTLTLTVRADARREGNEYTLSGFRLFGGKSIPLRLPNFVGTGVCTAISEIT